MGNKIPIDLSSKGNEEFILKYLEQYKNEMQSRDPRRLVFVSLVGLLRTWNECPPDSLYHAILILPLKKKWVYHPKRYLNELQKFSVSQNVADDEFLRLLKWKDSQGLAFFMMDYSEFESVDSDIDLIHPFWNILSNKLSKITDLTDTYKHNELNLDEKWWTNKFGVSFKSKYRTTKEEVLDELHFLSMKYKTIQEILYQSNPNSLHPIKAYSKPINKSKPMKMLSE
eukprot:338339_1